MNKFKPSEGYSGNVFDIETATINGIIYTALDPSIFQIRYPNTDIRGKVLGVVGLGRIGREVIKRALGFEMKILVLTQNIIYKA